MRKIAFTVAVLTLALSATASAHKPRPFLTVARAKAAIVSMARAEGGTAISVTACRRGTAIRVACELTESGYFYEAPATLTERVTVRLSHGKLKLSGSLRDPAEGAEARVAAWGSWGWR